MTHKDIVKKTRCSPRTVRYALRKLKENKMLIEKLNIHDMRQIIYQFRNTLPEMPAAGECTRYGQKDYLCVSYPGQDNPEDSQADALLSSFFAGRDPDRLPEQALFSGQSALQPRRSGGIGSAAGISGQPPSPWICPHPQVHYPRILSSRV